MEENTDFMWNSPSFFPPTKIFNPKKHQRFPPCTKSCLSRNTYKKKAPNHHQNHRFFFRIFGPTFPRFRSIDPTGGCRSSRSGHLSPREKIREICSSSFYQMDTQVERKGFAIGASLRWKSINGVLRSVFFFFFFRGGARLVGCCKKRGNHVYDVFKAFKLRLTFLKCTLKKLWKKDCLNS